MANINFESDVTGSQEIAKGSDNRLNTSGRVDFRPYYISRDEGEAYSFPFEHTDSQSGEFVMYWKNTSKTHDLVISSIGINAIVASRVKLWFVSGTAAGGDVVTPTNLNRSSSNDADAICQEGASSATGITGLTGEKLIDYLIVNANSHEEFRLSDRVRVGQNNAIGIEIDTTAGSDTFGVVFGFYEKKTS